MNSYQKMKWLLPVLTFTALISAQGQSLTIPFSLTQSSPALTFALDGNGVLMSNGTENGTSVLTSGEEGAGTRFLWYPGKGAIRAGGVTGTDWDDSQIGAYSTAFGLDTIAANEGTVAIGYDDAAYAGWSAGVAIGGNCLGNDGVALGNYAVTNWSSVAIGGYVNATGSGATVLGWNSTATGGGSIAMGINDYATGNEATAIGNNAQAYGDESCSLGETLHADSYCSLAVGVCNVGGGNATTWVATDPLFEVGNGGNPGGGAGNLSIYANSDAFVVYKNGSATFQGPVTVAAGGDIPMFTGY
jgi:hypothetical protein